MRSYTLKLLLLLLFAMALNRVKAQDPVICKGSLGDPVINVTFGAGANFGPPSPYSTMLYVAGCPDDNFYTIVNSTDVKNGGSNCIPGNWFSVPQDHTGDPNGYMMFINASYDASEFFKQVTDVPLCQKTTYEFSAYVLNLLTPAASGGANQPKLKFTIETITGAPLATITKTIDPTTTPEWVKCSVTFATPGNIDKVVLKIENQAPGGNGNDLLLDDIAFRACGPVIQLGFNSITATAPQNICIGETHAYDLVAQIGEGYDDVRRQWQRRVDGGTWADLSNETSNILKFTTTPDMPVGSYQYRIAAAEAENINSLTCRTYSEPLTITVNPKPVVPHMEPAAACEGGALTLNATGGVVYEWHGPGITQVNKNQNPLQLENITPAIQGNYSVDVTSASGCTSSSNTFPVTVNLKPVITVSNTATVCKGNSVTISASAPGATSYSWSPAAGLSDPASSNPVANPIETTTYAVTVRNANDCSDTKTVTVNVLGNPSADAGADKKIFEGQSVMLNGAAQNANIFNWTPATGLSDPHVLNPIATPGDDITYLLTVSSAQNCGEATSSVFVKVYHKIVIPNAFSPNGDGYNDFWDIEALVTYPQSLLTVFNRYGQQVFKSIGYDKPWKGTYNGAKLPSGTYYYIIDLKLGSPKLTGWVLIVN
ncbi:gliding motility-associated C-terminal domain-containing protein [Mucilaginibacter sp.]|uniref:T9SS type B sorting domain-containing protein n=1 Tax=Mucilaginibacter sp. TaxID=1882438 RepID=UPI0025FA6058|nr:gliding motility-associated C-terminal domain-containing protein [Mucilaginibacter sp.]